MAVDLERMLERCVQGQWSVDDFDWTAAPIPLSREQEIRVCSYYVNMSYIERLAAALFRSLSERLEDPQLRAIFRTFVDDEVRHSRAAARLADYFDVHHYRVYTPNVPMLRFIPYFVGMIDSMSPAFATSFILGGELILDIALLRSLNAWIDDPLARAVVERINQDESRHLAMDMHMTEVFARRHDGAGDGADARLGADFWGVLTWAPGFFAEVFFRPMQILDPGQEQMRDVIRRFRRFYDRDAVTGNPAVDQFRSIVAFAESPIGAWVGVALEEAFRRFMGVDFAFVHAASSRALYGDGPHGAALSPVAA
jgi:rubrerythrin